MRTKSYRYSVLTVDVVSLAPNERKSLSAGAGTNAAERNAPATTGNASS